MITLTVFLGMVGPWQVVLIILALLFLFGGRKIPELMRGLGQGMKEFKKATREDPEKPEKEKEIDKENN